jgi:hypothetical protein
MIYCHDFQNLYLNLTRHHGAIMQLLYLMLREVAFMFTYIYHLSDGVSTADVTVLNEIKKTVTW